MTNRWTRILSLAGLSLILPPLAIAERRVGMEFAVSGSGSTSQYRPAVAVDAGGTFVVVWPDARGVFGAGFTSGGEPAGEFEVDSTGSYPDIAVRDRGDFVVVWEDRSPAHRIYGQLFLASGRRTFRVSSGIHVFLGLPQVAMSRKNGRFIVVWGADNEGVLGQRYSGIARPTGFEFEASDPFSDTPGIAMDKRGRFVVTWISSTSGPMARRFGRSSDPIGEAFRTFGTRIAMDAKGNFAIASGSSHVRVNCYDKTGRLRRSAIANTFDAGDQGDPAIAMDAKGRFVVVWESADQDGDQRGVFARQFKGACTPVGGEFQVNTHTRDDQYDPAVAINKRGDFVVVWVSQRQASSGSNVFAQRFAWR